MIDACDYGMGLGRRNDLHVRTVDDAHGIFCDSHHHFLGLDLPFAREPQNNRPEAKLSQRVRESGTQFR
jgi:hypothetical protein